MEIMNLPFIFRAQAILNAINGVIFWLASPTMLEMTNMTATSNLVTMTQAFATMFIVLAIVGWQLPDWAGDKLTSAARTFIVVNLIWSAALVYHFLTGATSGSTPVVSIAVNLIFASLYYVKSR
tara:strand:+ start:8686 stop:9057 length:372 start_codon:yes stop_codon:yes gene_type:complete